MFINSKKASKVLGLHPNTLRKMALEFGKTVIEVCEAYTYRTEG